MLGFLETDSMDPVASNDTFREIAEMIIKDNATPALWFSAAGGMILITLALNKIVTSLPRGNGVFYFPKMTEQSKDEI